MSARPFYLILGIVTLATTIACTHKISSQSFVEKASIANEFEIESSKLALRKSNRNDVKAFAKRMVEDHTKTSKKMSKALQASKSDARPADELDERHEALLAKLKYVSSKDFDQKYIAMQMDAHKEAVRLFSDYAKNGKNPELKRFAAATLPDLKDHLEHVKHLKSTY
jgi:putative membrane protein